MTDYPGKLIAFEGIDRAGKSSLVARLPDMLADCTVPVVICGELRSPIACMLRRMLRTGGSAFLKTFFFASDRAWTYEKRCLPALNRGELFV
jgi:thymidylate kinase